MAELSFDSILVHAGRPARTPDGPLNTPIVAASTMHAGGKHGYHREGNTTLDALEEALGALEGGQAIVYSSGMAAGNAVFDLIPVGSVVIMPIYAYTGTSVRLRELDARGVIKLRPVDITDSAALVSAITASDAPANWVWLESPTNPMMEVTDIQAAVSAAKSVGARVVVDNTFFTPARQRPLAMGADVVMHSVTKSLAGHSDLLMGALVTADEHLNEQLRERRVLLGAVPSAFDAFLVLRGLRTLAVRMDRSEENARTLAERLAAHPRVSKVRYPGIGNVLSYEFAGTADDADQVCESVQMISYATSLGGVESLMERRRRWPAENPGVPESLIRLAVGIESVEDLWADLSQALDAPGNRPRKPIAYHSDVSGA